MSSYLDLITALHNSPTVPHNTLAPEIRRLNIAFIAITDTFIISRILVRVFLTKKVALEDYLMVAAGLFATAFSSTAISALQYGLGQHVWDLPKERLIADVKKVIQSLWICQVMYSTALALTKLSIIAAYHRIFPTTTIRRVMYALVALIISVWIVSIFTTIFQCSPITGAWNFELHPKCISIMSVFYFTTAFSILTDVLLVVLPLPLFWKLKLPIREKWIVTVLFGLGLFASVASIMRITVLHDVQNTDATIGAVPTLNWSVAEVGTGIICACVPCLKPLFKKLLPGKFSTARSKSRSQPLDSKIHAPAEEAVELKSATATPINFSRPTTSHGRHNSTRKVPMTTTAQEREFV